MFLIISGTVGNTTLTESQLAEHVHGTSVNDVSRQGRGGETPYVPTWDIDSTTEAAGGSQSHTHTYSGSTSSSNNLPPFYSLALIMRLS